MGIFVIVGCTMLPLASATAAYAGAENAIISSGIITLNRQVIDNEHTEYPFLLYQYKGITYFPLTWEFAVTMFDWDYKWDAVNGLRIDTKNGAVPKEDIIDSEFAAQNPEFNQALEILSAHYTSDRKYTGVLKSSDGKTNTTFTSKVLCEDSPHGLFVKFSAEPFPFFKNGVGIEAGYYDRKTDSNPVLAISGKGEMLEMQEATIEFENSELGYLAQYLAEFQFSGSRKDLIKEFKLLSKDENTASWGLSAENEFKAFHGYDAEFAVDLKHNTVKYIKIKTIDYTLKVDTFQ